MATYTPSPFPATDTGEFIIKCMQAFSCYLKLSLKPSSTLKCNFFVLDEVPTLPELLQLKIPQHVGTEYKAIGIFLLHDKTGSRVNSFKQACLGDPENIVTRILEEWLIGKGKPCTWQMLIKTLRDCEFTVLADQIEKSKM